MPDSEKVRTDGPKTTHELRRLLQQAELVYDRESVESAIEKLAKRLTDRLEGTAPLVLCVMQGGLMFTGKIMSMLPLDAEFDYIHATRYRDGTRGDALEWLAYPKKPLRSRTVLLLDDILDQGYTLEAIEQYCREQGASEVISAVLLEKRHARPRASIHSEYVALEVDDRYVFGCGMDYKGQFRHLDSVYAISD